jgi:hypothetical protein
MKALFVSALIAFAVLPCRAHHEQAYGIFWKAGPATSRMAPASARDALAKSGALPADIWRYAFVSRYTWSPASR